MCGTWSSIGARCNTGFLSAVPRKLASSRIPSRQPRASFKVCFCGAPHIVGGLPMWPPSFRPGRCALDCRHHGRRRGLCGWPQDHLPKGLPGPSLPDRVGSGTR